MAILVSPGVSVTVTDESFYIPASAPTVPLIFIATAEEKTQPDGVTPAEGTYEHSKVRTITSVAQSVKLYGIPRFMYDVHGNPLHGDCRNEYGLFALNQFLGVGSRAFVVRANVNLDDTRAHILEMWNRAILNASMTLEQLVSSFIDQYNVANGLFDPNDPNYKKTVEKSELDSMIEEAMQTVYSKYSFRNLKTLFEGDHSSTPCPNSSYDGLCVYENGFSQPATDGFIGIQGLLDEWVTNGFGSVVPDEWTPSEASGLLINAANLFKYTTQFVTQTSLGVNDAARRVAIVQALQAAINSNQDIRSEQYEYNLVLCPGFHEVVDEMHALVVDINEEALVIADTPMNLDPDELVSDWADSTTATRQHSNNIAYYYPHGLASNLDGRDVVIAASGIALRTYAYNDNVAQLWFAPAGTQRGVVSGVAQVGYVKGTLGTPTTFIPVSLTLGQRDNLYKYFTNINPIAVLPGRGMLIFGQKTSQNSASALDRVNVSRLVKYIKRQLRKNLVPFLFEPNDQITRNNVKATVDAFLQDIMVKRGLYDFAVLCDESNNTPDRIDRNELYVDIALKPMKAVEFIYVPIRILSTGAQM